MRLFLGFAALWLAIADACVDQVVARFPDCENNIACSRKSVVSLLPLWPKRASRSEEPEGSGIVVGDGKLIATADHIIGSAKEVLIRTFSGEVMDAEIVLRDAQTDIALLRTSMPLPPLSFSRPAMVGSLACALGNSFGLDVSVTCGVVSATQMSGVGFNRVEDFVQTDAAVNPGMSGGALLNENGQLLGMLSAIFTKKSDSNIGVNFAVSAELLQRTIEDYLDDGMLERVSPGVVVRPALMPGKTGTAGALVVRVKAKSAEEKAGILQGDIILFAGARRIKRAGAYAAALALLKKRASLTFDILRNKKRRKITVVFD